MYQYNAVDQALVDARVKEFTDQTQRFLKGALSEEQFRPLRLMNGLYIQRHAPMLRVAIPYGLMNSKQLRMLADIADRYDKGYGHMTTRQNIQFNWIPLEKIPQVLGDLASVQMHAMQTSGNCIRNVTADHLAGVAEGEVEDPRPYCELIRQWSTLHPEFSFLPRKFKFAVSGCKQHDRAAVLWHDIGLYIVRDTKTDEVGFEVLVGGGMGRTPFAGKVIREFLPKKDLLSYLEAILRIYNEQGRRDNIYKSRIKILVNALGIEQFRELVEVEWAKRKADYVVSNQKLESFQQHFQMLGYQKGLASDLPAIAKADTAFEQWFEKNTFSHKVSGYRIVMVSLKSGQKAAGDISSKQMHLLADLSDQYSFSMIRSTHDQNLVLPDVEYEKLYPLWQQLKAADLATANIGTIGDLICCPGFDFCSLANAPTIDLSMKIQQHFEAIQDQYAARGISLKMSGCMNACGHHHAADIGILGVDKKGEYWYQIGLGGSAALGLRAKVMGPAVPHDGLLAAIDTVVQTYTQHKLDGETFLATYKRIGVAPFKKRVYQ